MGGLVYGLSIAVKVQIGLPFLAYLLWRRRWRTAAVAGVVVLTLTIIAVAMLQHSGVPWLKGWIDNVNFLSGPQEMNNPGPQNPDRRRH